MESKLPEKETGTGEESKVEIEVGNFIAKIIHIFLSVLAILLVVAGAIAIYDTVISDFPTLWRTSENEYAALLKIIDNLLLVAIAVEFSLLLLFRRMTAVVEVVVFVLARKTVNPDNGAVELLLCAVAIAGLIILQHYFLPAKAK